MRYSRDHRLIERKVGRYVSETDGSSHRGGHFELREVPAPPQARLVRERSAHRAEVNERLELTLACPHCMCAVEFVIPIVETRDNFAEEVMESADRERRRFYEDRARDFDKQERVVVSRWLESAEEFKL